MTHPPTSSMVAADTADERVGSATRAVGKSLGSAFRGVGSMFGGLRRRSDDEAGEAEDFEPFDFDEEERERGRRPHARRAPRRPSHERAEDANAEPDSAEASQLRNADAWGLGLIGLAAVIGASVWMDVAGPVGRAIAQACHWVIGAGALILPVVLVGVAVALMLNVRTPAAVRGRVAVGLSIIAVAMLGMVHVFAGNPGDWETRRIAGGAVGALAGGLLAAAFTPYVAVPLLALVIVYGALKTTGITVREAYDYLVGLFSRMLERSPDDAPDADADTNPDSDDLYGHVSRDLDDIAEGRGRPPDARDPAQEHAAGQLPR